ncbi:MAG TPA: TadE family protein [Verrucomicrobiae bacterium]|nr:TadE family protein [Verrucomicrobiae bacterium]
MIKHLVRRATSRLTGFARESDGASAVEFALVFPLAFFLIAASFELGMLMFNQAAIESAVREAARYGMTGQGTETQRTAAILAIVDKYTYGLVEPEDITITTETYPNFTDVDDPEPYTDANGNGQWDSGESFTEINGIPGHQDDRGEVGVGATSEIVQYTISYDWQMMILPFITNMPFFPDGKMVDNSVVHFVAKMTIRNEPFPMPTS